MNRVELLGGPAGCTSLQGPAAHWIRALKIRYHIDPTTGLPHIYQHYVSEQEVEDILGRPLQDIRGRDDSRIAIGQTEEGRYLRVIYVPDPIAGSVFVIRAYELDPEGEAGNPPGEKEETMTTEKHPPRWNEARIRRVLEYYESQSDEEAAAEIEAGFESTTMEVPSALVPAVRELIAKRRGPPITKTHSATLHPSSRARRKSKSQGNSRPARG
jgi:hypothetical protein